jgi:hypothetical protein
LKNPLECNGSSPFLITLIAINRFRDLWKKKIISLRGTAFELARVEAAYDENYDTADATVGENVEPVRDMP